MDLAKVAEVAEVGIHGVNGMLSQGWVLVGFVERPFTTISTREDRSRAVYILGKPRPRVALQEAVARQKDDESWRRKNLPIDDRRHPDFLLHAKGSS